MAVKLFSNGREFSEWEYENCYHCVKQWHEGPFDKHGIAMYTCDIDAHLTAAYCSDGTVPDVIAERMGCPMKGPHIWPCKEFVEAQDWRSAFRST
jgi:hypothetical protein